MSSSTPGKQQNSPQIGRLAEKSLHASLKARLAQPGDQQESVVDGFVIDIVRGDTLIEIQTRHLGAMRRKLHKLLPHHPIQIVHPIAAEKWIVRQTADGHLVRRRKSPKRGQVIDVFTELVRLPDLLTHPNLIVTVLLTRQEEIWRDDGQGSWRRKGWSVYDHQLLEVVSQHTFTTPTDWLSLLPAVLPDPFTNRNLAHALACRLALAQKMTYSLRHASLLQVVGKRGNALLFRRG